MIVLRKMNNERFLVNHNQIECIELIPECKIVMMNHDYYLVKDTVEEIIQELPTITRRSRTSTGRSVFWTGGAEAGPHPASQ